MVKERVRKFEIFPVLNYAVRFRNVRTIHSSLIRSFYLSSSGETQLEDILSKVGFFWWRELSKDKYELFLTEVYSIDNMETMQSTDHSSIWENEKKSGYVEGNYTDLLRGRVYWGFGTERTTVLLGVTSPPKALKQLIKDMFCLDLSKTDWEYGYALKYVPETLITEEICLAAIQTHYFALQYVPAKFMTKELCLAAVQWDEKAIIYVPEEYKTEEEIVKSIELCFEEVQWGEHLCFIPDKYKTEELCLVAASNLDEYCYISPERKKWFLDMVPECLRSKVEEEMRLCTAPIL